jgi:hypothetical protein
MLATREDARGQGFSRYLGAPAMAAMADRFGKRRFDTGVRPENAVSQKLCRGSALAIAASSFSRRSIPPASAT